MEKERIKRMRKEVLASYKEIIFTQPLADGLWIKETCTKGSDGFWYVHYHSNSATHICPFDGNFRRCDYCAHLEDNPEKEGEKICTKKDLKFSPDAVIEHIYLAQKASIPIEFWD